MGSFPRLLLKVASVKLCHIFIPTVVLKAPQEKLKVPIKYLFGKLLNSTFTGRKLASKLKIVHLCVQICTQLQKELFTSLLKSHLKSVDLFRYPNSMGWVYPTLFGHFGVQTMERRTLKYTKTTIFGGAKIGKKLQNYPFHFWTPNY